MLILFWTVIGVCAGASTYSSEIPYEKFVSEEDVEILNEVISDLEQQDNVDGRAAKLVSAVMPLPASDVKCLTSSDEFCSVEMGEIKNILIQAVQDDCLRCSTDQKEDAGRVLVTLMAHHPTAWKTFLTKYDGLKKFQKLFK